MDYEMDYSPDWTIENTDTDAFDLLLDAYKDIGNSLPQFGKYAQLLGGRPYIRMVLVDIFESVLMFHKRVMGFVRRPGLSPPSLILCKRALVRYSKRVLTDILLRTSLEKTI